MAEQLAKRFGHNPNVVGWQIDNEYAEVSFDSGTRQQFQEWLKQHYGTLDNLNTRWTTSYWSETYFDWNQVPIQVGYGNPGLLLSWMRFVSDTWRSYQRNQLDVIHANCDPRQFVTTNMMGWFNGYDHYTVAQDLDLAAWDDYVGQGHLDPVRNGAAHDLTRGFKGKNFWVMETQPGGVNWASTTMARQRRGARWRGTMDTVPTGSGVAQYHGTIVGPDGTPDPLYEEVAQIGREFDKASPALAGTAVKSDIAILHSYDSRWAIEWQKHNKNYDPVNEILSFYGPLRAVVQSVDIVSPTASLSQYKLVVAPGLNVLTEEAAKNLRQYVNSGGHLVLGQRSAMKDIDNDLWPQRQRGQATLGPGSSTIAQPFLLKCGGTGEGQLCRTASAKAPDRSPHALWQEQWSSACCTRKVGKVDHPCRSMARPKDHGQGSKLDDGGEQCETGPGSGAGRSRGLPALRRAGRGLYLG